MSEYILEMQNITKEFPGVLALDSVNLKVKYNEIHAICGENGAGKSTLIKTLCGIYPSGTYDGKILLNGQEKKFSNISIAENEGIVCIHQELELIPELSVAENIFLGNYPTKNGFIDWAQINFKARTLLNQIGLSQTTDSSDSSKINLDPSQKVSSLGVGHQQLVEIAKALARNAKILILDEPTAALTESEVDILLNILNELRSKGMSCIYISHKLDEVLSICNSVTVIRDGKSIGRADINNITKDKIVSMMIGRELTSFFPRKKHTRGELVLEVKNYFVDNPNIPGKKLIKNVNFKAYKGEILGISGLMGAGRTELFSSIYGVLSAKKEGDVFIKGERVIINNSIDALKHGLFLVTEDRKRFGLVLEMDVKGNNTLASLKRISTRGFVNKNKEIYETKKFIETLRTKTPSLETPVKNLSGGNQQKIVLQKALMTEPEILIFDEPTRGIDVGAKYAIYEIMNDLIKDGITVIMISSEMEEILGMSDRILVMREGEFVAEYSYQDASQEKIMKAFIEGKPESGEKL